MSDAAPSSSLPPIPAGTAAAFIKAIERLEEVIELETQTLQERKPVALQEFNHRKRQGLLEISRIVRAVEGTSPNEALRIRIAALREKLERNRAVLHTHLRAVQEIAAIIARAIQEAESDGTYSVSGDFVGKKR